MFFDDFAIFPDDDGEAEAAVFGAEFAGGAVVGAEGEPGELGKFTLLLVLQWSVAWSNHEINEAS